MREIRKAIACCCLFFAHLARACVRVCPIDQRPSFRMLASRLRLACASLSALAGVQGRVPAMHACKCTCVGRWENLNYLAIEACHCHARQDQALRRLNSLYCQHHWDLRWLMLSRSLFRCFAFCLCQRGRAVIWTFDSSLDADGQSCAQKHIERCHI